jgi:hypothetical protein
MVCPLLDGASYTLKLARFGTVALLLQLVPVLSMLFLLTSAAGSALWAVKLEELRRIDEAPSAATITGEEIPPSYTDNPV